MGESDKREKLKENTEYKRAQVIDFYGYKDGVGKTTALIKTAILLASKGKKAAVIDMDLEAPGFYDVFSSDIKLEGGVVKYLFDKFNGNIKNKFLETSSFVKKLYLKKSGAVYVLGAGRLDKEYVKMLSFLSEKRIKGNREIEDLVDELTKSYGIDYILIDSRNGLNDWCGLSLFKMADEIMMFAYPDKENLKGISLALDMVPDKEKCTLVFSKVEPSETGHKEAVELFKKIDIKQSFKKIDYDSSVAAVTKHTLENRVNKYSFISDIILENEIRRKNKKWINEHKDDVNKLLASLAEGKDFNKILSSDDLKAMKSDCYAIGTDDRINMKDMIEGYDENKEVKKLKFYNIQVKKAVEKHCSAEEFLDVYCLAMMSLALFCIDGNDITDIEGAINKYFMDFYYKSNSQKGRIINASAYFSQLLKDKEEDKIKVICININELIEFISVIEGITGVSKTKNNVLFRMIYLAINVLNRNSKFQFKLILPDKKYKNDEDFRREFKDKLVDLSWQDTNSRTMIIEKVKNLIEMLFKQKEYAAIKKDVIFPISMEENGNKVKFVEWFVDGIKKRKLLSRKDVLKILQESAAIELNDDNERDSIIAATKLKTALERISYR